MSSFMFVLGNCVSCSAFIRFSPTKVPSVRLVPGGPREPLCRVCAEDLNDRKKAKGLPTTPIQLGAYDGDEVNF